MRLQELDSRVPRRHRVDRVEDPAHQHAGEQEIGKHDDAAEPETRRAIERRADARVCDAAERRLGPAEAEPLPQHARDLRDIRVGVGIVGAAANDNEQRFRALALRRDGGDTVGRRVEQLRIDAEIAAELHLRSRMRVHKTVHLPRQVVLDVARGEQHARNRQYSGRAACLQFGQRLADRRPGEFEEPRGLEPVGPQSLPRLGQRPELLDPRLVAAAVGGDQQGIRHGTPVLSEANWPRGMG
jgi:hypothetical protein